MITYIGIDLGIKGAVTVCRKLPLCKPKYEVYPFYDNHDGLAKHTLSNEQMFNLFQDICSSGGEIFCTIEHPVFMPLNGKKAIASLHENFGLTKGILIGLGVNQFWLPKPVQWKKVINAHGSDKSAMYVKAKKITNHPKLSDVTADSVLICAAGMKHFK